MRASRLLAAAGGELAAPAPILPRAGRGGRASDSGIVATVFGATGFVGRYVVNQLGRQGSKVIIPYRGSENSYSHLKVLGDLGQIVPLQYSPRNLQSIERAVAHSNVVINLIGNERRTYNYSLDDTNRKLARLVARVAKEHRVGCYVHVSDLRADLQSPSEYARIKGLAELEVRDLNPQAIVVRPAPCFGAEDKFSNAYGVMLRYWTNVIPLIGGQHWHMQPVFVADLARAIVDAVQSGTAHGRVLEVVGPQRWTHAEMLETISRMTLLGEKYHTWPLHPSLAAPLLRVADWMPRFRPHFSSEDALMRMGRDALPSTARADLDVVRGTKDLECIGLLWLRRFRKPKSLNQVTGLGSEHVHPYRDAEADLWKYYLDDLAKKEAAAGHAAPSGQHTQHPHYHRGSGKQHHHH